MPPTDVTLEMALKLLAFPKNLGAHPQSGEAVLAKRGRFGPYVECGSETRSLPRDISPLDVTLEQAVELLAQPKAKGRGRAAPKEPLKTFDKSPVTDKPIQLLEGRYGNYVTDGVTNASLPRDVSPDSLTHQQAVDLLAERAERIAAGAGRRPIRGRSGNRKATAKPTTAAKARTGKGAKNSAGKPKLLGPDNEKVKWTARSEKKSARKAKSRSASDDDAPF
jgi:DNA topoisomerase-1